MIAIPPAKETKSLYDYQVKIWCLPTARQHSDCWRPAGRREHCPGGSAGTHRKLLRTIVSCMRTDQNFRIVHSGVLFTPKSFRFRDRRHCPEFIEITKFVETHLQRRETDPRAVDRHPKRWRAVLADQEATPALQRPHTSVSPF